MTIYRRGHTYVRDGRIPQVIGPAEAERAIRQANGGKLPAGLSFDIWRAYWEYADTPIPAPPAAAENHELTEALKLMTAAARRAYGGYDEQR